jgi:hypothetical protein
MITKLQIETYLISVNININISHGMGNVPSTGLAIVLIQVRLDISKLNFITTT